MKKILILVIVMISLAFASKPLIQVSFETGEIGMLLDEFGRIEVYAPDLETKQIDKITLMVGGYGQSVFDYWGDASDSIKPTEASPTISDFELSASIDNFYSGEPPAYLVDYNIYGWFGEAYSIIKLTIKNIDSLNVYNAKPGFDIIPKVENIFGEESYEYVSAKDYFRVFRGDSSTNTGIKLLSSPTESLTAIDFVEGYNTSDSTLYDYLNYGSIDNFYQSDSAGSVVFTSVADTILDINQSFEFYFAVAVGANPSILDSVITAAEQRYSGLITSVAENDEPKPTGFSLSQNYPNPFNPTTSIEYQVSRHEMATLKVYDILGSEIKTLVNKVHSPGTYKIKFDASELPSGVYFYRLQAGELVQTRKMLLIK